MGVIGLDLSVWSISGMPRMSGWPRKKSGHKTNANDSTLTYADFERETASEAVFA